MSDQFLQTKRPGYLLPVCPVLEKVISGGRMGIAVSLNVSGGVHLIKTVHVHTVDNTHWSNEPDMARDWP